MKMKDETDLRSRWFFIRAMKVVTVSPSRLETQSGTLGGLLLKVRGLGKGEVE